MIKAIIFDCFGVLVGRGFDETYRLGGGDPQQDKAFIDKLLNEANRGHISQSEFRSRLTRQLNISNDRYNQVIHEAEQPNYELLKYIKELRKHYKTAILSNVNTGVLERKIEANWLQDCFDAVVVSAEVGFIKPEPEIYTLVAEKLAVKPSECVFIDDKLIYANAAKDIGMQGLVYDNLQQMKRDLDEILTKQ